MKIVGIDASLTSTGIAILEGGEITTQAIKSKLNGIPRLIDIRNKVKSAVKGANLVVIEGYALSHGHQAHAKGELGGVLRVMLYEAGLPILEVPPAQVKKFATGRGNAKKEEMAVAIYKRWGREFPNNDEADAYVLARIGEALNSPIMSYDVKLTAFQVDVIDSLRVMFPSARSEGGA